MVLTRRAYKSISRWLPNEIITEIILQVAPRLDQASLCRVSKLFHGLCLPILYRVVCIETPDSAEAFYSTICANTTIAGLVRSFTATSQCASDELPDLIQPGSRPLVDCLKCLLRVVELSVHSILFERADLEELLECTFPRLSRCSLPTPELGQDPTEDNMFRSFLSRHPTLEKLHIQTRGGITIFPAKMAQVSLLHLQQLRCPAAFTPSIIAHDLEEIAIDWYPWDGHVETIEAIFTAVKSMSKTGVSFTISGCDSYFAEIMVSASDTIPHAKTLRLKLYDISSPEIFTHLRDSLPHFKNLAMLSLESLTPPSYVFENSEETLQMVRDLVDACPTLEALCLGKLPLELQRINLDLS